LCQEETFRSSPAPGLGSNFHRLEARSQRSDVAAAAYTTACSIKVRILLIQPLSTEKLVLKINKMLGEST
jgi:hypothetical protein